MNGREFAGKLRRLAPYGLVFTPHAELRLVRRQIERGMVEGHLRKPDSLKLVEKLESRGSEEKYKLWFVPYRRTAYIYVIVINHFRQRIVVKTAIKQRIAWQRRAERYAK